MSYLLWQRESDVAIASSRLVLRAEEVPLLVQAQQLRDELEALRHGAAQQVEAACAAARVQGLALGREQGLHEAREELAATVTALTQAAAAQRAQLRGDVAMLALQVVRKLMDHVAPEARLLALAEVAARELLSAPSITLRVHPDRCDAVRDHLARHTAAGHANAAAFDVVGDAACALDDCRLETELGSADASLETQLTRLAEAWGVADVAPSRGARSSR